MMFKSDSNEPLMRDKDAPVWVRPRLLFIATALLFLFQELFFGCAPSRNMEAPRVQVEDFDFTRGKSFYEKGDYNSALTAFKSAIARQPGNWLHYNWLGWTQHNLNMCPEAITQFRISNSLFQSASNYQGLGQCYLAENDYASALENFSRYAQLEPNDFYPYNRLGWTYHNMGKYLEAVAQFKKANNIKEASGSYEGLGQSYLAIKDYEGALAAFRRYSELEPKNFHPYNRLGWTYYNMGNYREALGRFGKANEIKKVSGSYLGMGVSYCELGQYGEASSAFSTAMETAEDDRSKEEIGIPWASCCLEQGDYKKAYEVMGKRPFLGITVGETDEGISLLKVVKGSPSDKAGLKRGDIMTRFDNRELKGVRLRSFLDDILGKAPYGADVPIRIRRGDSYLDSRVQIGIDPNPSDLKTGSRVDVAVAPGEKKGRGMKWALVIGVSAYQDNRVPPLRYASSDARAFHDWLISSKGGRYSPSYVRLLIDEEATGRNIKSALFEWLKGAIEEDMVVVYFAGHGSAESPDSTGNLYLLPYDTQYDSIATTGFPMWDIETALRRFIRAKKVVVIADACHSGGVGQSFDVARRAGRGIGVNPVSSGIQGLAGTGDGICVVSASGENQYSQESQTWGGGHGVFTYFLIKALEGDADYNKDVSVSLGELTSYLSEQVRRETRNAQSPTVAGRFDPSLTLGR
jgi:tetratricopeptide (TPR) repeat protein/uncharacterized caspase-like protein